MEGDGILKIILAVWGVVFTINSALSAILQTKWMHDSKKLLKEIRDALNRIDWLALHNRDDIQKGSVGGLTVDTIDGNECPLHPEQACDCDRDNST